MGAVGAFRLRMKLAIAFLALTSLLYGVECHLGSTTVNWKYYYFDAVLPAGDKCGQQKPVTGWTVTRNGATNVRAGFGTRVTNNNEWQSQSVCWTERLALGSTYQVNFESTGGNDCIEETGWDYARFSCFYVSPN